MKDQPEPFAKKHYFQGSRNLFKKLLAKNEKVLKAKVSPKKPYLFARTILKTTTFYTMPHECHD